MASSCQALLWYAWTATRPSRCGPQAEEAQQPQPHPKQQQQPRLFGSDAGQRLFLGACAFAALASTLTALSGAVRPPPPQQQLLPGSVFEAPADICAAAGMLQAALLLGTMPCLTYLVTSLPRSFTPGEAGVLLQALLALGGGSAAYLLRGLLQGPTHLLWAAHVVQPDPGMHVPAFAMLVLFWVIVLALACKGAAAPSGTAPPHLKRGRAAADGGVDSSGSTHAGGAAQVRQGPAVRAKAPARPASAAGQNGHAAGGGGHAELGDGTDAAGGGGAERPPPQPPALQRALDAVQRVGSRGMILVAAAALADLGLWVLGRFVAASSRPRLATLAYWFGCLAVTVPFMYALSKASAARQQQQKQQGQQQGLREGDSGTGKQTSNGGSGSSSAAPRPPSSPWWQLLAVPHVVMRKGYHLVAILLFLPAFGWDLRMLQASLAVAGGALVLAELARCAGPPLVRQAIGGFMADFADARDSGPVYITHFTLLLGIAVPVWLSDPVCGAAAAAMMAGLYGREAAEPMAPADAAQHLAQHTPHAHAAAASGSGAPLSAAAARLLPSCTSVVGLSGLVSLGSGDTAAACVGFLLGRLRLFRGGRKTWEGTVSGMTAMMASWVLVVWWLDVGWALRPRDWAALAATTAGVSLLEAVTMQLDNVVVPLYYVAHLVLLFAGR